MRLSARLLPWLLRLRPGRCSAPLAGARRHRGRPARRRPAGHPGLRDRPLPDPRGRDRARPAPPATGAAVEWGVRTMKELGFQNVRAEKVTVPHWERGAESGEIVSPWPQPVVLAALGGSVGTPEGGIEAEVVAGPRRRGPGEDRPGEGQGARSSSSTSGWRGPGTARATARPWRAAAAAPAVAGKLGAVAAADPLRGHGQQPHAPHRRHALRGRRARASRRRRCRTRTPTSWQAQLASGKPVVFRLELGSRYLPDARVGERDRRDPGPREAGGDRPPRLPSRLLGPGHRARSTTAPAAPS